METTEKRSSMWDCIHYVCATIMLLVGLAFLPTSCKEIEIIDPGDISGKTVTGKDGNLNFAISFDSYEKDEGPSVRSAIDLNSETIVVPLGDDFVMSATLEPAIAAVSTRSSVETRSFNNNARLRIVAYLESGSTPYTYTYACYANYIVEINAGTGTSRIYRDGWPALDLTAGSRYKFVAYSYNDDTTPLPSSHVPNLTDVHPDLDLVWGSTSGSVLIGTSPITVPIHMEHMFSKVNLKTSSGSNGDITAISNVEMSGFTADMAVETGFLTNRTPIEQPFVYAPPINSSLISTERIVFTGNPAAEPTIVRIGSITVGSSSFTNLIATFAKKLESGYEYNITIHIGDVKVLTDDPPPAGFIPYVGAFWKHDQTGERLIRMARTASGEADGTWSASVIVGADWIVLDKTLPTDVTWNTNPASSGNDPGFDASHQVGGSLTYVSGVLRSPDNYIYFRIGLKSTYTPTSLAPARYGVVLLTYANNTRRHRIWIRQGEDPDYLMRPNEPTLGFSNRPEAQRFSPYNLTTSSSTLFHSTVDPDLTKYPTQTGAFFQWANNSTGINSRTRFAWDPFSATLPPALWNEDYPTTHWTDASFLFATHESCPLGYRRPNDGPTNVVSAGSNLDSEIRQSLWVNPHTDVVDNRQNSLWGYYADGYFDRRAITNGPGITSATNSTVSATTYNIANIGNLFYNPANNASLFFPASGFRGSSSTYEGALREAGTYGLYWTSSSPDAMALSAWYLTVSNVLVTPNKMGSRAEGLTIRCVKDDFYTNPMKIWLSPSPGNSAKSVNVFSDNSWTLITPYPTNATVSSTFGTITFTRSATDFGLAGFQLQNSDGKIIHVVVDNYYIDDSELIISNKLLTGNTDTYDIDVFGGSETFTVVSSSSWITATKLSDGKLQLIAPQSPDQEERTGFVILAHADDPTYQVTINVTQTLLALPPFQYLVIWFEWVHILADSDVDIGAGFFGNNAPFDGKGVGWGIPGDGSTSWGGSKIMHNGDELLLWGGDARQSEGETVFFNTPIIDADNSLQRYMTLKAFATWYHPAPTNPNPPFNIIGRAMRVTVTCYEGGSMHYDGVKNFYNSGGTVVYVQTSERMVYTYRGVGAWSTGGYTHVVDIVYDRLKHSARVVWINNIAPAFMPIVPAGIPMTKP